MPQNKLGEKMLKICIVNLNVYCLFDPKSSAPMGGAELDMYTLAKGLGGKLDTTVVTGDWGQESIKKFGEIKVLRSVKLGGGNITRLFKSLLVFWKVLSYANADIYVTSGAGPEVGVISYFCRVKKKKFIYRTASDIDCNRHYARNNGIRGRLFEFGLTHADRVVTSVRKHQSLLMSSYPNNLKQLAHINLGAFSPIKSSQKKRNYILWVARCERLKNPEAFLEIAERLPQYQLVMICSKQAHDEKLFNKVKEHAASLPNVEFINYVPYAKIQPFFDQAKVFVNTSDFEGFTFTLIQSGLGSTPVAYWKVNPDNVITHHGLGCFGNGNMSEFIVCIRELMASNKKWLECSKAIRKYVGENHNVSSLSSEWMRTLESLR
jgi:glycosyltransferase involved in cell wall biosynthesis